MTEKPNKRGTSRRRNRGRRSNKNKSDKLNSNSRPKLSANQKNLESNFQEKPKLPSKYYVKFYNTFQQAKEDQSVLSALKAECDQLNIIIKEEAPVNDEALVDDPDLIKYGKVFAGAAWTMIHQRRVEESFYTNESTPPKSAEEASTKTQ